MKPDETGYRDCACRDCFEIAIGILGALCTECVEAECEPDAECSAPDTSGTHPDDQHA